ncbi:hypothetical protein GZL_08141 [Streptomyces sp. 769]|nr:hypothetical protein GZL_08141 [Streptomyces sp. 769]
MWFERLRRTGAGGPSLTPSPTVADAGYPGGQRMTVLLDPRHIHLGP